MSQLPTNTIHPLDLKAWRDWLSENHATATEVWMVSYKRHTGQPRVEYETAVEEALCWGWIDSVKRTVDGERTMQRFSPRKKGSGWARTNKDRLIRLQAEGRVQPAGQAVIDEALRDGSWTLLDGAESGLVPDDLAMALGGTPEARSHFDGFPASERKQILGWIDLAKAPETRARRIAQAVRGSQQNLRMDQWKSKETL